ncbi:ribosomal protein S18-alanine N-acetyltransferase [Lapidilactobacillus achengensis]|uniref:Ribosomal protein S18-alanine N-acetyltransferase n=1 Tax=Lapidilactobacillus achengensis TaxID=2486000 RepID=A0ABW1UJF4_9LACO|nr:ribosomal protein S18-alanine N-acetyltransferase [Lapidilactobacillus achengensis]
MKKFKQFFWPPVPNAPQPPTAKLPLQWQQGTTTMTLRRLVVADLNQALAIERDVYQEKMPWDRLTFMNEMTRQGDRLYLGLEANETELVGFIGAWFSSEEVHITNIALLSTWQRQGLGRRMMTFLIEVAQAQDCQRVTLEARVDNEPALGLYRQLGFKPVRIRHNYYEQEHADAVSMLLSLDPSQQPKK